jgi:hypothetical protein
MTELPDEHRQALQAFADAHGRGWKDELSQVYWYNARIWSGPVPGMGARLHEVRNSPSFGPTWLYDDCDIKPTRKAR